MNDKPHWLPRGGSPLYIRDGITQRVFKIFAWLPVYTAIVCTLTLLVVLFGVPHIGEIG